MRTWWLLTNSLADDINLHCQPSHCHHILYHFAEQSQVYPYKSYILHFTARSYGGRSAVTGGLFCKHAAHEDILQAASVSIGALTAYSHGVRSARVRTLRRSAEMLMAQVMYSVWCT